ncbi:lymphocyte antigen 75 [Hypomesus transpacificus]|uniref:lymphocyte antigen 75 n=1 Tax=Hypomesus transpacificus TaxID=137520 RepID=UPI001F078E88|nr:lymphocyte antigen 75 [Hypomesus transpacificus]
MEKRFKGTVCLYLFLLVWEQTIWFGCCALAGSFAEDDIFTIEHNGTGQCMLPQGLGLALGACDAKAKWKWGSSHQLFHLNSTRCLGVEVRSKTLGLYPCNSTGDNLLGWFCRGGAVYTQYQISLGTAGSSVRAQRESEDVWMRGGSKDNICQRPYRVIHTSEGNSAGAPCVFPFLYAGGWTHGCLSDQDHDQPWCSTSSNYDLDRKWGVCLTPEEGCGHQFQGMGPCYQFGFSAAVSWQEALDSCRSQGADLLSMTSPDRASFPLPDGGHSQMPERVWVGLHQLDSSQGWQWSDGSPLSYLRWNTGMPPSSSLMEQDCGVMNSQHSFEAEACGQRLPYICKKTLPHPPPAAPAEVSCECEDGWVSWGSSCFQLGREASSFSQAQALCVGLGGNLSSLHSLDSLDMIHTHFHTGGGVDVWTGLKASEDPAVFRWTDSSPVLFTHWGPRQPRQPSSNTSCVCYSGESHGWRVEDCDRKLPFLCQRHGQEPCTPASGCLPGWRRHGSSCYKVDLKQVAFEERCNLSIRNRYEQAFVSRLLGEQDRQQSLFFWTSLQDVNNTGEFLWISPSQPAQPLSYANWGWNQPDTTVGGCVVMSSAQLGRWEVRNCGAFRAGSICRTHVGSPAPPAPTAPSPSLPCPKGWISREGISYCYKVFHEERLGRKRSWEEAERFCEGLGAHLPSLIQPLEMSALHSVMRDTISNDRFFWVGLNRRDPADPAWTWSDGRPVSMDVLHEDFHHDDEYDRNCAAFKTTRGTFRSLFLFLLRDPPPKPFFASPFHCDAKMEWVCQIPRGRTALTPEWYNPDGHHQTSFFMDGAEFWLVSEPVLPYEEASLFCSSSGSRLASPRSFDSARLINTHLPTVPQTSWWVDLRDPGSYFPMTFNQMRHFHQNFLGRCTSFRLGSIFPDYERSCGTHLPFVCERHNSTLVERNPLQPHPWGMPCRNDSIAFRDKCYKVVKPRVVTFKQANELCQSLTGTLVSISDQVEQDFVTTLLPAEPQASWIGLKLRHSEPEWVDNTAVSFLNFNPLLHGLLRPMVVNTLDPDSLDLCVFVPSDPDSSILGTWDYTSCSDEKTLSFCQYYADKPEAPSISTEPFQVRQHTFQLLHQNLTWLEALEACRHVGMDLASVADALQQAVLSVHVSRARSPMWLGLSSEDEGVHYHWTDHSHTLFSRWSSEPTSGDCVSLDVQGFWRATPCEEVLAGAVCHIPNNETIVAPEDRAVKCPHKIGGPNWIPFKKNCYTFQLSSSRWDEFDKGQIQNTCKNLDAGADILTIRTAEENEFIQQQLLPFSNLVQFVWLGLFADHADQQMKWYDGTNVQFSKWREGRPEVQTDFLAALNTDGEWEVFTNTRLFNPLKQRSIVACKLDNASKAEYTQSPRAYERYGNLSYSVVRSKLSWFEALGACAARGGHLASVHDAQNDAHVQLIARRDGFSLWIGLSSQDAQGSVYEWSDGTKNDYQRLSPGLQGCVLVTPSGAWDRKNCHVIVDGAICYNTTISTPFQRATQQLPPTITNCPESQGQARWVEFQDHCYAFDMTFYNYSVYSMEQAKDICLGLGAQVLTIKTKEENDFVRDYMEKNPLITSRAWLGLDLDTEGQPVSWMDGSTVSFSNFGPVGQWSGPGVWGSGRGVGPPCVVMVSADAGSWTTVSCKDSLSRLVCKTSTRSRGLPVALGFFIILLLSLLAAIAFILYKKNRTRFSSTVRYKRNFDEADTTSIINEDE